MNNITPIWEHPGFKMSAMVTRLERSAIEGNKLAAAIIAKAQTMADGKPRYAEILNDGPEVA